MRTNLERRTTISRSPPSTPRLRLRPSPSPGGVRTLLDGGWWPRSADPVAELPGLILALDARHGLITRVMLRKADWNSHPHRLRIDDPDIDKAAGDGAAAGRVVRLGWFDSMPTGLLTALCTDGRRVDLVTVPAHVHHASAAATMELAADPGNHVHTPELLAALGPTTTPVQQPVVRLEADTAPEDAWESEGGWLDNHTAGSDSPRPQPARTSHGRRSP
jgi:Family of unknown function (DUF5994)